MKGGWHDVIEGIVNYYQSTFNMAMIVAKLSEYNDILKIQIIAKSITGDIFLHSSNIRSTEKLCVPEDSSATMTA